MKKNDEKGKLVEHIAQHQIDLEAAINARKAKNY
ncbi:hypothetical protein ANO14919_031120 [Xylariales sp. No.14919]|nr:hypothetical protein ANO14919_031120 [Xylariales sp. No.14919]